MKVLNNLDSLNGVLDGSSAVNDNTRKGINYISATLVSSAKWENSKGYPTTWKANTTLTPVDGMTISLKMPSAGHDYGVFLSLDNGTNYYPIGLSPCTNTRLTTHFGNGSTILLQYSSTWQINDLYAVAGAASRSNIVGGWKIVSSYLDGNTVSQIREENGRVYAGTNGISPYTIIALDKDGKYQSLITTATTGTGTNKTINTSAKFKMEPVIRYYNANNTNTNGNLVASTYALYSAYCAVDTRYSHNHTVTFTTNTPLYIECTIDSDGFWSPTSTCITQTLTSGKYYIFLGNTYSTEYQISLSPEHPVYYYDGTRLNDYTNEVTVGFLGNLTSLGTNTPAEATKTYWTDTIRNNIIKGAYNNSGQEYSLLFSKGANNSYGSVIKWGYPDRYMRILRMYGGNWQSDDWEKMSAGYADSAGTLTTARTIEIGTGATGTATSFNGSANITIPITEMKEAYNVWGGKNISGGITPDDMGCIDEFGHNKLAFLRANCITAEYTTDGGSTWLDYGLTDAQKIALVTTTGPAVVIGKGTAKATAGTLTNENCGNYKVRVMISTRDPDGVGRLYTRAKKVLINFSSSGAGGCKCLVENRTIANYNTGTDSWSTVGTYDVNGWSGWNSIPYPYTLGGGSTQTGQIAQVRFTLSISSVNTSYDSCAYFIDFRLIGETNWTMPSELARAGHLYTMDAAQNATFPAALTSTGALTAGSISTSGNITASSGDILLTKNGSTGGQQVKWSVGSSDFARVYGAATASNAGYLEIATADDSNEPIYARQYSGNFATVTRTANILDASGNTSFPGTLTANKIDATKLDGAIKNGVTATTQSAGDNSTKVATTAYVDSAITALPEPMIFKGSLGTGGTITSLPTASASNEGFTYKVITAGTYASQAAKVGDTFISDGSAWVLIPSGDEPNGTVTSVKIQATSPIAIDSDTAITTSGTRTLSHANSGVTAGTYKSVTVNATGHVTAGTNPTTLSGYGITDAKIASGVITLGSNTITPLTASSTLDATKLSGTIPSGCYTDTKNTAGSTDSSSKLFLVGATSQASNPQTYSQDTVYAGTDGHIYSNNKQAVNLSDDQDLTNKTYEGYTLQAACGKDVDEEISAGGSTNLATSAAVVDYLAANGYGPTNVYVGTQTPASPDIVLWMNPNNPMVAKNGLYVGNKIYLEGAPLFWYEEY